MYEVQIHTTSGWSNEWFDDEENPIIFNTLEEAKEELASHLQDLQAAVEKGDIEGFRAHDYRVAVHLCAATAKFADPQGHLIERRVLNYSAAGAEAKLSAAELPDGRFVYGISFMTNMEGRGYAPSLAGKVFDSFEDVKEAFLAVAIDWFTRAADNGYKGAAEVLAKLQAERGQLSLF